MTPDASLNDIKKQYRKLAAQYHPDRTKDEAHNAHFLKLTEAYEVLGNENKRELYDQSYGMGNFKNFISSKTTTITAHNYDRLVVKSGQNWVIQVFDHDSYLSQTFADTWEKIAAKYYFLNFGRIDRRTQQKLLHRLPFRPLEFPFLFTYPSSGPADFVDYSAGDDLGKKLLQTIKDTLPTKIQTMGPKALGDWFDDLSAVTEPHLVYLNRAGFDDILYLFESTILNSVVFHSTRTDLFGIVQAYLKKQYPDKPLPRYILIHPANSVAAANGNQVEFISTGYHTFASHLHLSYPPSITRAAVDHMCKEKICLVAGDQLAAIAVKSMHDATDSGCRLLTVSEQSASEFRHYFSHATAGMHGDRCLAVDTGSDRLTTVIDAKATLIKDDFEALCETSVEDIKLEGQYLSDRYANAEKITDLLDNDSLFGKVVYDL